MWVNAGDNGEKPQDESRTPVLTSQGRRCGTPVDTSDDQGSPHVTGDGLADRIRWGAQDALAAPAGSRATEREPRDAC
ncbi:hypothetical protein PybrP1_000225 [[Pythium] brassicae (nom. inval.)]|nr:hypothetical protein PybrP1_000225 [[Pythium] brassicae (nom. inval.)]